MLDSTEVFSSIKTVLENYTELSFSCTSFVMRTNAAWDGSKSDFTGRFGGKIVSWGEGGAGREDCGELRSQYDSGCYFFSEDSKNQISVCKKLLD